MRWLKRQQFLHQAQPTSCVQGGGDDHVNVLCELLLSRAKASASFPGLSQGGMGGEQPPPPMLTVTVSVPLSSPPLFVLSPRQQREA